VADSEALRSRRKRAHAAGDHSLCRRCAAVRGESLPAVVPEISRVPVADPKAALRELARQLADAYSADPANALLARELRMTLQALIPAGKPKADDEIEDLFASL
jgi:hypothetical protein